MIEPQGNLVKTYHFKDCTVEVYDAAYAGKTEAELDQIRLEAFVHLKSFLAVSRCSHNLKSLFFPGNQFFKELVINDLVIHKTNLIHNFPQLYGLVRDTQGNLRIL